MLNLTNDYAFASFSLSHPACTDSPEVIGELENLFHLDEKAQIPTRFTLASSVNATDSYMPSSIDSDV